MFRLLLVSILLISSSHAADWLAIQGTQSSTSKDHNLWGFGQFRYIDNRGDLYEAGGINKTPFSLNKPTLQEQETLIVARLRTGVRGRLDRENKVNYFILTELGENGISDPIGYRQHSYLTDLSVTFRHLPVNIRAGQFKYPGSEEGLMARFTSPFIQFTTLGDQLMLERFIVPQSVSGTAYAGPPAHSVGAYRDSGIELFDTIAVDDQSSISYAYMLGLGAGLRMNNVNGSHPTHYLYGAYEKVFGKIQGYHTESFKIYGWYQEGKRVVLDRLYDRVRYGAGFTYFDGSLRIEGEYMGGRGMIFTGAADIDPTPSVNVWQYQIEADEASRGDGYYIAATYRLRHDLEALARYDTYRRMTNSSAKERIFTNSTVGFSYRFKGFNRIDVNYTFARAEAPYNTAAQAILDHTGDIARMQLTLVYR